MITWLDLVHLQVTFDVYSATRCEVKSNSLMGKGVWRDDAGIAAPPDDLDSVPSNEMKSQQPMTPVPGDVMPCSDSQRLLHTCSTHAYTQDHS